MKQQDQSFEAALCAETIDACSDRVRMFLAGRKLPKRDIVRYTMTIEELLLKASETAPPETSIRLQTGIRFFRPFVSLEITGSAQNIYTEDSAAHGMFGDRILKNLGLSPEYTYTGGRNTYYFRLPKKRLSPFISLIIALAAAFAVGFGGFLLPETLRDVLLNDLMTPLHDTFLHILGCIAGPMVFLSVAWGIYGIGDAATFKRIGKKMILGYSATVYVAVILIGTLCIPLCRLQFTEQLGSSSAFSELFSMLLGIIPENIFSPFVNGNTLQIIFLAIVIGIAMLFLGQKTNAVAKAVEQINYIVQFLIEFISKLVPYFIFIVLVKIIWSDAASIFLKVGKVFAVFGFTALLVTCGIVGYTALRNRVNPLLLIRKGLPTLLIAITTASSAAAFGTNMNACRKQYGIHDSVCSFGVPLGMVAFKPLTALCFLSTSLIFAEMYKIPVSASWIVLMMITVGILALATPPIPGGALTAYTVLFTQLGIPAEALAIALACDTLFDFVSTGFDQFLLPMALLNQSGKLGLVDYETLRKAK